MPAANPPESETIETRLCRHPASASVAVGELAVQVTMTKSRVRLLYRLKADLAQLRIPAPGSAKRTDGLWKHSCFEAFFRSESGPGYLEFNFSPSGEWAAYRFQDYRRDRAPMEMMSPPGIRVLREQGRLDLEAVVSRHDLQILAGHLRLGLTAVIEALDGSLSYWALKHPSEQPDFHHPDSYALSLPMDGLP